MQVIVTGASGFLGQAVLRALAAARSAAVGVSRQPRPGLVQVAGYEDAPAGDVLVHLAQGSDRAAANAGGAAHEAEAVRTLEALLAKPYRHVVYASSAVLYGDRAQTPRRPSDPVDASDTYARIKLACEQAVLARGGTVARLANLYGPGMATSNVLGDVLAQLGNGEAISMQALHPVRDFLWVDDAAAGLVAMAERPHQGVFNLGSGTGTSVAQLVDLVQQAAGTRQQVLARRPAASPSSLVLDVSATTEAFGWTPSTSLQQGIGRLVSMNSGSNSP